METIRFIFAVGGSTALLALIVGALRNGDDARLAEGLLIGIYAGVLGSISLLVILRHLGVF